MSMFLSFTERNKLINRLEFKIVSLKFEIAASMLEHRALMALKIDHSYCDDIQKVDNHLIAAMQSLVRSVKSNEARILYLENQLNEYKEDIVVINNCRAAISECNKRNK